MVQPSTFVTVPIRVVLLNATALLVTLLFTEPLLLVQVQHPPNMDATNAVVIPNTKILLFILIIVTPLKMFVKQFLYKKLSCVPLDKHELFIAYAIIIRKNS